MRNLPTKIIIRHLPPKLTEEHFKEMCSPIPPYDYFRFCSTDPTLGGKNFCRAYINFCDPESVFAFRERFSDYVFVDSEGNEANAIVEYAVFQGTPNTPPLSKVDRRQGTIDEDSTYQKFLANLNASQSEVPNSEESSASKQAAKTPWEATLEALEKREAAASQQTETALTRFLNMRLERSKRNAGDDFKGMSRRGMRASRNARKARQRQAAVASSTASVNSDATSQSVDTSQKSGDTNAISVGGRGGSEKSAPSRRGPKSSRSNKPAPDSSSFGRSDDPQQSASITTANPVPMSGGRGSRRGGRRGGSRSRRNDAPPSYSSRHAATVSESPSGDSGGPKNRGGGQRGGSFRPSSYYSRGRASTGGAASFKK
ncbi:Regulator of nonsense transcript 3A [Taenia solium]|eukprot:TsM_000491800 transcript=TsM_000491800 gene=TsM_000491800